MASETAKISVGAAIAELQESERLALRIGEGRENRIERRRGDGDQRDQADRGEEEAAIDRLFAQAHARKDRPVRHHQRGVDELQHVTAAPEQFLARRQLAAMREQRRGDAKADQRQNVDEAAKRHRDRKRRRGCEPPGQIDQKANDRRKHAQRQRKQPDVIGRMANDRNVIGELGLRRLEEGRREQAGKSQENRALPDPPERRGAHVVAGEFQRRDADQEGENALQPDHQREHDVDHQALIEKVDRPEWRLLHAGDARQRQQKREHAGDRERADGEPCPADELALDRALRARDRSRAIDGGDVFAPFGSWKAGAVNWRSSDKGGPPSRRRRGQRPRQRAMPGT